MTVVTSTAGRARMNTNHSSDSWSNEYPMDTFIVPAGLVDRYLGVAMRRAEPRRIDAGRWYADLPGFPGVWADGDSPKECLDTLMDVLRDWIFLKLQDGDRDIPVVDEIDLTALTQQR